MMEIRIIFCQVIKYVQAKYIVIVTFVRYMHQFVKLYCTNISILQIVEPIYVHVRSCCIIGAIYSKNNYII